MTDLTDEQKRLIALRYSLASHGWFGASRALEWMLELHSGTRKDGVRPEWSHLIATAMYLMTLTPWLREDAETFITVALLHDVLEDKAVTPEEMRRRHGEVVTAAVLALSRKLATDPGAARDKALYYAEMVLERFAPLIKAADRIHNLTSMIGVFSEAKQLDYVREVVEHILPMLKRARRRYPEQMMAIENAKLVLEAIILPWRAQLEAQA